MDIAKFVSNNLGKIKNAGQFQVKRILPAELFL